MSLLRFTLLLLLMAALPTPGPAIAQVVTTYATGLTDVWGIAFDAAGNLYSGGFVGGQGVIRRKPAGGGPATIFASGFGDPTGMTFGPTGDLFVADMGAAVTMGKVWRVKPDGSRGIYAGDLQRPRCVGFDASGNLLVSEWTARRLKIISPARVISDYGPVLGDATEFPGPFVIDPSGDVLIGVGHSIKRVGPGGSPITVVASGLGTVIGLARGPDDEFYVTHHMESDLWVIPPGGVATRWAGSTPGCIDGVLEEAKFGAPLTLTMFASRLYIADNDCHSVRTIETPTPSSRKSWGRVKAIYR